MDKKLLGRKINLTRKEKGLTIEQLAEQCNINATYLRQIESGAKMPSLPVFITLCRQLSISPSYLLADYLTDCDDCGIDGLVELSRKATPSQLKMVSSIIRSALDSVEE